MDEAASDAHWSMVGILFAGILAEQGYHTVPDKGNRTVMCY